MFKILILFSLLATGCYSISKKTDRKSASFQDAAFFENSVRRDPTPNEIKALIRIENNHCSAFFVKNTQNKLFVGTHNHCAQYELEKYCSGYNSQKIIYSAKGNTTITTPRLTFKSWAVPNVVGYCKRVVAKNDYNDFMIIEIGFNSKKIENRIRESAHFLRLADFIPPDGTKLKMLGHPADSERQGQPTVTENCYIQNQNRPIGKEYSTDEIAALNKKSSPRTALGEEKRNLFMLNAEKLGHNCSTYGGNSGGPILIAGSDIVIGLPGGYYQIERKLPAETSIFLETTRGLIDSIRGVIEAEEISTTVLNPDTSI